jgi:hypothetical protein
MIAGVVATLTDDAFRLKTTLDEFVSRPGIEVGKFHATDRRISLTIDSPGRSDMEDLTDWIRSRQGVAFVDVVCVHFEETDDVADLKPGGGFNRHKLPPQETTG